MSPDVRGLLPGLIGCVLCAGLLSGCGTARPVPGQTLAYTVGDAKLSLVYVPARSFPKGTDDHGHATVKKGFWIGQTEITYELWKQVWTWGTSRGYEFANPGLVGSDNRGSPLQPATTLNWRDTIVWSNALTEYVNATTRSRLRYVYRSGPEPIRDARGSNASRTDTVVPDPSATGFRVPTADEWELAARYRADRNADGDIEDPGEFTPGTYASGATAPTSDPAATAPVAVYSTDGTRPVGSRSPNALGIFDMSGNVDEWCFDVYPGSGGAARVARGGTWIMDADSLQLGLIERHDHYTENSFIGFRVARLE